MKPNDSDLIKRILSGDDDAFSLLVKKHQKQVHALAWRIMGDFHIAEEITQDTFLIAYKDLKNLKEPQSFAGWLSVITRHQCNSWLSKESELSKSYVHLQESDPESKEITLHQDFKSIK